MTKANHDKLFGRLKARKGETDLISLGLIGKADIIRSMRFDKQNEVADDPSRFIGVVCGRRAGKSTGVILIVSERCLRKANSCWVICGLARPSIKRIYWRTVKKLNDDLDLHLEFNEADLTVTFPNGSIIYFAGANNAEEIEKLRGSAYDGVVVDECKSFNLRVFDELIDDVIRPALSDRKGTLILIGTPGRVLAGTFYLATAFPAPVMRDATGNEYKTNVRYGSPDWVPSVPWSSHHWTAEDNLGNPGIWVDHLDHKKRMRWADNHPTWRREYLGEWVIDTNFLMFRYDPTKCHWSDLPTGHLWNYVLGIDPGYDDAFGFVVLAYSPSHPNIYEVYSEAIPKLNITNAAKHIKHLEEEFGGFECMTGDRAGLGKMIFEEFATIHDIYIIRAEKGEKEDFVELINTDFDQGIICIKPYSKLAEQLLEHRFVIKNGRRRDSDETANDCCDAFVYAYRYCEHKRWRPLPVKAKLYSDEYYQELEILMEQQAIKAEKARNSPAELDKDWW